METVRSSFVEPVVKPASSLTSSFLASAVKESAFSSSTRPQPWQFAEAVVVPVMFWVELTSVARSRAAEGVKASAAFSAPEGYQPLV